MQELALLPKLILPNKGKLDFEGVDVFGLFNGPFPLRVGD